MKAADILDFVLKVGTFLAIVCGGGLTLFKMGRMSATFERVGEHQAKEIADLKNGMSKVEGVLVALANQSGRTDRVEDRVALQGQRIDTLSARFNAMVDKRAIQPVDPIERA